MRIPWDEHFLRIAREVASMGTCARRQVGCVLVDERNRILSTGFNGVPPGFPHCRPGTGKYPGDEPDNVSQCPGAAARSGTDLDLCRANHSEANALIQCAAPWDIATCYCTTSPCISCIKMLLCTGTRRIVFLEEYPHAESRELWTKCILRSRYGFFDREWIRYENVPAAIS